MKLERLPPHITGFFDSADQPRSLDGTDFKKACHQIAQINGGTVERIDLELAGRSYFGATIRTTSENVSVLCNSVYPYVAFVQPNAFGLGFPELTFIDPVHLTAAFANVTSFQPLDAEWLEADLSSDLLADLTPSEQSELAYWKPKSVGQVVFNSWD